MSNSITISTNLYQTITCYMRFPPTMQDAVYQEPHYRVTSFICFQSYSCQLCNVFFTLTIAACHHRLIISTEVSKLLTWIRPYADGTSVISGISSVSPAASLPYCSVSGLPKCGDRVSDDVPPLQVECLRSVNTVEFVPFHRSSFVIACCLIEIDGWYCISYCRLSAMCRLIYIYQILPDLTSKIARVL